MPMTTATRLLFALLAAATAWLPAAAVRADEAAVQAAWKQCADAAVADLAELAAWCHKGKLFRTRNETYAVLLQLDPDHAAARKRLRYKKDKDGGWTRSGRYKHPRNLERAGPELLERRDAVAERFADAVLAFLERSDLDVPAALRARALWIAARVSPERKDIRRLNGEIETAEGTWILAETLSARTRRRALADAAAEALTSAPAAKTARPTSEENSLGLRWTDILTSPHLRVMGTIDRDELEQAIAVTEASLAVFETAFGVAAPRIRGYTMYLLKDRDEQKTLLAKHGTATEAYRERASKLASSWLPKTRTLFIRAPTRKGRIEWCARQTFGRSLRAQFGADARKGWIYEGFGLYLDHLVTGRRQTLFVRRTKYEEGDERRRETDLWDRLKAEDSDWRAEARALVAGPRKPDLLLLLGKDVNSMNTEDLLYAYVIAAWCLEGRPRETAGLLGALCKKKLPPADALRTKLGLDPDLLEARVIRWLEETK